MILNKIYSVFISLIIFTTLGIVSVFSQVPPSSFTILNEIQVNNPGSDNVACEYVEIRGDFNALIPGIMFLLEVEGDGSVAGTIDFVTELSEASFGPNGIIAVKGDSGAVLFDRKDEKPSFGTVGTGCGSRNYGVNGANVLDEPSITFENGTISFLLVSTGESTITVGTDIDTNNDGVIDNLPKDATIVDAVGWTDGGASDFVYGGVDITPGNTSGAPDGATRNFENLLPLNLSAWFADDITDTGSINSVLYSQTNLLGTYMIDFMTPGRQNLAPTTAGGSISGRVRVTNDRGLSFVTLKLSGGHLQEPIYRTTNHFGNYRFDDLAVGQSYVLETMSGRYTFQNPNRVINLDDSVTNADFFIEEGSLKNK